MTWDELTKRWKVKEVTLPDETEVWPIDPKGEKRIWRVNPNVINLVPNSLFCLKISSIQHHLKESDMSLVPAVPTTDQAVFQKII